MIYGVTRVRDEVDIAAESIRLMLDQVDRVIVGEGHSTDGTRAALELLVAAGLPVEIRDDLAVNYAQRDVLTGYAHEAREAGAEWVVFFDVDELWRPVGGGTVAEALRALPEDVNLVAARAYDHVCTGADADGHPFERMVWRRPKPLRWPKVACRALPGLRVGHGNHSATFDGARPDDFREDVLRIHHFPYRSPEQFVKRVTVAWPMLKASGLPRSHGLHTRLFGEILEREGEDGLRRHFAENFYVDDPLEAGLVHDPV